MGFGDEILGSGMARGARANGYRVAFGNHDRIMWSSTAYPIFEGNANVARPGSEGSQDLRWIAHYAGNRIYNRFHNKRWVWNYDFKATPGEIFLSEQERLDSEKVPRGCVVIEPNVPMFKSVAPNKMWHGYQQVVYELGKCGLEVVQFDYKGATKFLKGVTFIPSSSIRTGLAYLSRASLYVGPEGGLHHAAAAFGIRAVVLFGGFIPPAVTGYDTHINLTGGAEACGSTTVCSHCLTAMKAITVEEVVASILKQMVQNENDRRNLAT